MRAVFGENAVHVALQGQSGKAIHPACNVQQSSIGVVLLRQARTRSVSHECADDLLGRPVVGEPGAACSSKAVTRGDEPSVVRLLDLCVLEVGLEHPGRRDVKDGLVRVEANRSRQACGLRFQPRYLQLVLEPHPEVFDNI